MGGSMQKTFGYFYKMSGDGYEFTLEEHYGIQLDSLEWSYSSTKDSIKEDKEFGRISNRARPRIFKLVAIEVKDE